jgi:hypothetical protein
VDFLGDSWLLLLGWLLLGWLLLGWLLFGHGRLR